jgi:glutamate carboxypeptidase
MPVRLEDGMLRGPGVYDMKAGLTQIVFALRALHALAIEPQVAPVVFVNSDEEIGSIESAEHIHRLAPQMNRAFVLEPSLGLSGKLKTARKGVGRFQITVHGRAAHAGLDPEKGVSAILELSHVIQKLFALNDSGRGISVNVGIIEGGTRSNVIAAESQAIVDVRVPTQADADEIEVAIRALQPETPGTHLEISGSMGRPPLERTPGNRALWRLAQEAARAIDLPLDEGVAGGGSDGNYTSLYTATLDGLGAVGDGAHADHEFIFVDSLVERAALLAALLTAPPLPQ